MPNNVIGATQLADSLLGQAGANGVALGPLIPPVAAPATWATTGGSIAAGTTVWYRFTAVSASGESLASTEYSAQAPSGQSTNAATWTGPVPVGATAVKAYGRTQGAEQLIGAATISNGVWSFQDAGSGTPSGALPTIDASGATGEVTLYTCPANTYVKVGAVTFANDGALAAAGCALSIVPSGSSAGQGTGNREAGPFTLRAGQQRTFTPGHSLAPGDRLTVLLPNNLVSVRATGKVVVHS